MTDFRTFPLRVDFLAQRDGIERKLFMEQFDGLNDDVIDLNFICQMASSGRLVRTNIPTIDLKQLEQIGIVDKLCGASISQSEP